VTAIGFLLAVSGYAISYVNDYRTFGLWAQVSGAVVLVGGAMMMIGVMFKLWEIMP